MSKSNLLDKKLKLEQRKMRLQADEIKLKLKERKCRTRTLIEHGALITKANLDNLNKYSLYGALLHINQLLVKNPLLEKDWENIGKASFVEEIKNKTAIIVTFPEKPSTDVRDALRTHSLKFNHVRSEWYGLVTDLDALKLILNTTNHKLEILKPLNSLEEVHL